MLKNNTKKKNRKARLILDTSNEGNFLRRTCREGL